MSRVIQQLDSGESHVFIANEDERISYYELSRALKRNTTLTYLTIHGCTSVGMIAWGEIAKALGRLNSLTVLNINKCNINIACMRYIAEHVFMSPSLKRLNLSRNKLCDECSFILEDVLKSNTTITQLNLAFNDIRSEGATALARAIRYNMVLINVNLCNNFIGNNGVRSLAHALEANRKIQFIRLHDNVGITTDTDMDRLHDMLELNKILAGKFEKWVQEQQERITALKKILRTSDEYVYKVVFCANGHELTEDIEWKSPERDNVDAYLYERFMDLLYE